MRDFLTVVTLVGAVGAGAAFWYLHRNDAEVPDDANEAAVLEQEALADKAADGVSAAAPAVEQEARDYIREITQPAPLSVSDADKFVRKDQVISLLPKGAVETLTPKELLADPALTPQTPVTIVKQVEQIEVATPQKLAVEAGLDLEQPVKIVEGAAARDSTMAEVFDKYLENPQARITILDETGQTQETTAEAVVQGAGLDLARNVKVLEGEQAAEKPLKEVLGDYGTEPVTVVKNVEHYEIKTLEEIRKDPELAADVPIQVIKQPTNLEAATVGELLGKQGVDEDAIYYVRTIRDSDEQGIWGIVQYGLIDNFARGIALRRGEDLQTYQVAIPGEADELVPHHGSSYLGRLIHQKTIESYVYNFTRGQIGRNPNLVYPGQEIVIIKFPTDELIGIYKHFVDHQSG